jgi:hypothetical protein
MSVVEVRITGLFVTVLVTTTVSVRLLLVVISLISSFPERVAITVVVYEVRETLLVMVIGIVFGAHGSGSYPRFLGTVRVAEDDACVAVVIEETA